MDDLIDRLKKIRALIAAFYGNGHADDLAMRRAINIVVADATWSEGDDLWHDEIKRIDQALDYEIVRNDPQLPHRVLSELRATLIGKRDQLSMEPAATVKSEAKENTSNDLEVETLKAEIERRKVQLATEVDSYQRAIADWQGKVEALDAEVATLLIERSNADRRAESAEARLTALESSPSPSSDERCGGAKCDDAAKPEVGPMQDAESLSGVQALGSSGSSLSEAISDITDLRDGARNVESTEKDHLMWLWRGKAIAYETVLGRLSRVALAAQGQQEKD